MIKRASVEDIEFVAPLFDLYRQFYLQVSDLKATQKFLQDRLSNSESVIFIAFENETAVGFTQLYPGFSSIGMKRAWILNDLFVLDSARGKGLGELMIHEAIKFAKSTGASSLSLETAQDNPAQKLYERLGFKLSSYKHYSLSI
jgi:GNAT superfamily N-acetyltransferase